VGDREDEEAVAAVGNTSKGVVPSSKGSQQTEEATGLDHGRVRCASTVALEVTNTEEQESQVQEEEQQEEGHGGSQGAEEQDCGENEPALKLIISANSSGAHNDFARQTYHQEQSERVVEHGLVAVRGGKAFLDFETTRSEDNGEG
jgi:hypothetical protein